MAEFEEEVVEEQLTPEELFEQHKEEIEAAFEEKGFFKRFSLMCSGLSKPHDTPEYKIARLELQRMAAPIIAIVFVPVFIISLCIITAVTGQQKDTITVDLASAIEEDTPLDDKTEEIIEETPPEEVVDISVDVPVPGPVTDMVAPTPPTNEPLSVKPADQDSVAIIKSPVTMKSMAGSRNPGSIGRMTSGGSGYGDATTEAAVLKALRWLKKTQRTDGSWHPQPVSNTALAILAFLAHGETPSTSKEFGNTVELAMQYLITAQGPGPNGVSFNGTDGHEYATLIATYALGEAYGMTKNPDAKVAALKSMERIIQNQSPTGGWDYNMKKDSTRDDLSYAGWALQALKACKMAGLHPDGLDECIKKAIKCLKTRNFKNGGFNYVAGGNPTGLTATGCLAMQLLGYMNEPEVRSALDFMREWKPSFEGQGAPQAGGPLPSPCPQYYSYYASQCKYQAGMCQGATPANVKTWQEWNLAMKQLYPKSIIDAGTIEGVDGKPKACGYWKMQNEAGYAKVGGDTQATCLCALQLMVYYRYLPTTSLKASEVEGGAAATTNDKKQKKQEVDVDVDI